MKTQRHKQQQETNGNNKKTKIYLLIYNKMKSNKTKILIIAVLATIIAGGAILNSCKKDESLTTKTENVSAEKQQKYFDGYWQWFDVSWLTEYGLGYESGWQFITNGKKGKVVIKIVIISGFDPRPTPPVISPPSFSGNNSLPPSAFVLTGNLSEDAYNEFLMTGARSILEDFSNYSFSIGDEPLNQDFERIIILTNEDGEEYETVINQEVIKDVFFPRLIKIEDGE